jgi:hypothetical protein
MYWLPFSYVEATKIVQPLCRYVVLRKQAVA